MFAGVITTFFYTHGFLKLAPGIACRDERGWIKATWYVSVVGFVLATFVYWLGSDYHALIVTGNLFTFVIICLIVVYYLLAKRCLDYIDEIIIHKIILKPRFNIMSINFSLRMKNLSGIYFLYA